jgi:hypothetical protein
MNLLLLLDQKHELSNLIWIKMIVLILVLFEIDFVATFIYFRFESKVYKEQKLILMRN